MMLSWLWVATRSILSGWAALFLITYLLERPLLIVTAPLLGASWFPTARLGLDCAALAATGWTVGRLHRSAPALYLGSLAATAASHVLMFGSLIAGGLLSRPAPTPLSIVGR